MVDRQRLHDFVSDLLEADKGHRLVGEPLGLPVELHAGDQPIMASKVSRDERVLARRQRVEPGVELEGARHAEPARAVRRRARN